MNEKIKDLIPHQLRLLRLDKKLSQEDLAQKIGVNTSTLNKYENNNSSMQIDMFLKILNTLDTDIFIFFKTLYAKTQEKQKKETNI